MTKSLSRLSPDIAIEAYRKSGLKPIRGAFMNKACDGCCPMGVLAMTRLKNEGIEIDGGNIGTHARRSLGFRSGYVEGFVCGFDNENGVPGEEQDADFVVGLSDGRTVWISLVDAGLIGDDS